MPATLVKIFRPNTLGVNTMSAAAVGAVDLPTACDPGDPISHTESSYASAGSGGSNVEIGFKPDTTFTEKFAAVDAVWVKAWMRRSSSSIDTMALKIVWNGGNANSGQIFNLTTNFALFEWDATSANTWTDETDFQDVLFEFRFLSSPSNPALQPGIASLWSEVTYVPESANNPQAREVASRRLRRSRFAEEQYSAKTSFAFLNVEIGDIINVSENSLPASATALANIEDHRMRDAWRRMKARAIGQTYHLGELAMTTTFSNEMPYLCSFWSTEKVPDAVNDNLDGLAMIRNGQLETVTRNGAVYVEQSSGELVLVGSGRVKMNHLGSLSEEAATNLFHNPSFAVFSTTFTDWTHTQPAGGFVGQSTFNQNCFADTTTFPGVVDLRSGTGGADAYVSQTRAVLAADGWRRFSAYTRVGNVADPCRWRLQRASDSFYWNDSTEAWQAGSVWNLFSTTGAVNFARASSNPILCNVSTNWTFDCGHPDASLFNKVAYWGQVDCTIGKFLYNAIPNASSGTATTTVRDERKFERTTLPQVWQPAPFTLRCTVTALQDGDHYQDGDKHVVAYLQSTAANYELISYEKSVGNNVRFLYEHVVSSSVEASAHIDYNLSPGEVVEVAARQTSNAGELGLTSTISILANGTKGTDGTVTTVHSASQAATEWYPGNTLAAGPGENLHNYISDIEIVPFAIADEGIQGNR